MKILKFESVPWIKYSYFYAEMINLNLAQHDSFWATEKNHNDFKSAL